MNQVEFPATLVEAPALRTTQWFNTNTAITLESCLGKVVVLHAFQMLCPGCVSHGLPQAKKIHSYFSPADVVVIGIHSVFEHHAAMQPVSLQAFIHEYRLNFPIAIDQHESKAGIPLTMQAFAMRGTPSLILIDRKGFIRAHIFGQSDDLQVGAAIARLIA